MILRISSLSTLRLNHDLFLIEGFFAASRSPMAPPKVVVEYAKSGRSSCKGCSKAIAAGALRLGSSAKDPRGFDMVKWFHVDCFQSPSRSFAAAEELVGFSALKDHDKDALRKLDASASLDQTSEEHESVDDEENVGSNEKGFTHDATARFKPRDHKRGINPSTKMETKSSKKAKVSGTKEGRDDDFMEKILEEQKADSQSSLDDKQNYPKIDFHISDSKDTYKDATLPAKWKAFKTVIFREKEDGLHDSEKIAGFDFDGCLANTSVKRIGADAWSLMYPSIPEKLKGLYNKGYKLVIFTNESNIERWKNKRQQAVDSKIGRLENFIKCVEVPIQVFIACGIAKSKDHIDDPFRKPQPGMWKLMVEYFNSGIAVDMDQSFYVGDAAGRINDHSDADIGFAKAIGLKFHLPEEVFDA